MSDEIVSVMVPVDVPPLPSETVTVTVHDPADEGAVKVADEVVPLTVPQDAE